MFTLSHIFKLLFSACLTELRKVDNTTGSAQLDFDGGNLCTYPRNGSSTCVGDSGGPLVNGFQVLIGVIVWGFVPCGDTPAVYTNVAHYLRWLRSEIPELA